jgi:MFS family permease
MSLDATLSWRRLFAPPYGAYLATFSLGSALYAFAAFLVSACMPSAVQVLGHLTLISWSFTFYLIAAIVAGILASPLKWRLGTPTVLQGAGLAYLVGSLACGLAPNIWTLLGGRVLQGLGEGAVSSITYILIPEVFPPLMIPAIFGIEATIWAAGSLAGPVIGGFLTQAISWRAAFLVEILLLSMLVLAAVARADLASTNRMLPRGAFSLRKPAGLAFWVVLLLPAAHTGPGTYAILLIEKVWGYDPLTASVLGAAMVAFWGGVGLAVSHVPPRFTRIGLWLGPCLLDALDRARRPGHRRHRQRFLLGRAEPGHHDGVGSGRPRPGLGDAALRALGRARHRCGARRHRGERRRSRRRRAA